LLRLCMMTTTARLSLLDKSWGQRHPFTPDWNRARVRLAMVEAPARTTPPCSRGKAGDIGDPAEAAKRA